MDAGSFERILVRVPNWIGDAVLCLPALECLKALYPSSSVTVLTKSRAVPVFRHNPAVEDIIEYEDRSRHSGIKGRLVLSGEIRERRFDLAVLFQNAFDAAFIAYISRIPRRVGYARDLRTKLLTTPVPVTKEIKSRHQVYYYLNIVKALGGSVPASPVPRIYLAKDELAWAGEFLRKNGLDKSVLIGAAPGASYGPAKRWMPEHFATVLKEFSFRHGAVPIIFGGAEDAETCKTVSDLVPGKHLNLAGTVDLRQFMSILSYLKVFITNDSGPMHISAALGVPTVAVFGSTDPALTGPLGPQVRVMIKKADCSPCFERECLYNDFRCLASIKPEEVLEAAESMMAEGEGVEPR
jgi:heptosyltransferase-2